jgi:hypothetical protein
LNWGGCNINLIIAEFSRLLLDPIGLETNFVAMEAIAWARVVLGSKLGSSVKMAYSDNVSPVT